jgi:hypothetical protein
MNDPFDDRSRQNELEDAAAQSGNCRCAMQPGAGPSSQAAPF